MTPHTIYFVRHGETLWNTGRRLQGKSDSPLTERGRAQAVANAQTLREAVPDVLALPFVVSPLGRARATMEIIRAELGLPHEGYTVEPRLSEMAFGAWEGLIREEIESRFPGAWKERLASRWTHVPPGGESFAMVAVRLRAWLAELRGDVVVVAHGAVGRVLRGLNVGMPEEQIASSADPQHDGVYRLFKGSEAAL